MGIQRLIKGFLIDLDGTVVEGDKALPGSAETLAWLKAQKIPYRFVTNTTSKPRQAIVDKLRKLGLPVVPDEIFTAPVIGREFLLAKGLTRCYPLIKSSLQEDLAGIELVEEAPQAVLVGDIGDELSYEKLNKAFRFLLNGAAFVALARNRYFKGVDGLCLDVGSIVAALEYASQREAQLVGKPARDFFQLAGLSLEVPPESIAVIGDDLEADVAGGKAASGFGILVRTGKFRPEQLAQANVVPDAVLDSFGAIPAWLG
jgi:HAD superfamily hydrolase (TIGR01458 family)